MSFYVSSSGYACLNDWDRLYSVDDILNLLLDLKRAVRVAAGPVILLMVVRESVRSPRQLAAQLRASDSTSDSRLLRTADRRRRRLEQRPCCDSRGLPDDSPNAEQSATCSNIRLVEHGIRARAGVCASRTCWSSNAKRCPNVLPPHGSGA